VVGKPESAHPSRAYGCCLCTRVGGLEHDAVAGLSAKVNHFLATMLVAVAFWMFDVVEDYIVGLMLLLAWVVFGIVPAKVALAGFSEHSWFFIVGSFGIAAAVSKTTLFRRLALGLLRWIAIQYQKTYLAVLLSAMDFVDREGEKR
jgi:di/tricarboxylate transporter